MAIVKNLFRAICPRNLGFRDCAIQGGGLLSPNAESPLADLESEEDSPVLASHVNLEAELDQVRDFQRAAMIIEQLPYEYALVLRWRYWEDQSSRSMAAATGRTEKAVERLLARAREKFKLKWLQSARKGGNGQ